MVIGIFILILYLVSWLIPVILGGWLIIATLKFLYYAFRSFFESH